MYKKLLRKYKARRILLKSLAKALSFETRDALSDLSHIDRISFRVKSPKSFVNKALDPRNSPPYKDPLVEIEDQVAGRVIVFFLQDLQTVKDRLERTFTPVESSYRRPDKDEAFGCESHHLIYVIPPK